MHTYMHKYNRAYTYVFNCIYIHIWHTCIHKNATCAGCVNCKASRAILAGVASAPTVINTPRETNASSISVTCPRNSLICLAYFRMYTCVCAYACVCVSVIIHQWFSHPTPAVRWKMRLFFLLWPFFFKCIDRRNQCSPNFHDSLTQLVNMCRYVYVYVCVCVYVYVYRVFIWYTCIHRVYMYMYMYIVYSYCIHVYIVCLHSTHTYIIIHMIILNKRFRSPINLRASPSQLAQKCRCMTLLCISHTWFFFWKTARKQNHFNPRDWSSRSSRSRCSCLL